MSYPLKLKDGYSQPSISRGSASTGMEGRLYYSILFEGLAAAAKSLQSCLTLCDPIDGGPPGSPVRGILRDKNTGVGCHFLLQCMKVKSESDVAQSCLTLCDPIDGSPPGSPVSGILQARILGWVAISFSV